MGREGLEIGEIVLSGWVGAGSSAVRLLVDAVKGQVASAATLLGDDTGHPVQDRTDGKLGRTRVFVWDSIGGGQAIAKAFCNHSLPHEQAEVDAAYAKLIGSRPLDGPPRMTAWPALRTPEAPMLIYYPRNCARSARMRGSSIRATPKAAQGVRGSIPRKLKKRGAVSWVAGSAPR